MKKDDYINSVMSAFKGRNKSMIEDELDAHLEDWIERYVEMGYMVSQAEQMAVEKMGDAELVGAKLTKIHSKRSTKDACFVLFFVYIGWTITLYFTILGWYSDMNLFTLGVEFSFLLLSAISLLVSNRLKSNTLAAISLLFTGIFFVGKVVFSDLHSILLYSAYLVFSGNIDDFIVISHLKNNIESNILLAFTLVFYSLWAISYVFTFYNISKFNRLKYSRKDINRENSFIKSMILVLLFFTVITAVLFGFKLYGGYDDFLIGESDFYYDGVCIIESDEICDVEKCYYNYASVPQFLCKGYDWGTMKSSTEGYKLFSDDCIESPKEYNAAVVYSYYTLHSRYANSKKYVAAIPVRFDDYSNSDDIFDYSIPCFDNVQWYDTDKVKEITGSLNHDTDPVPTGDYSIEICNVSAMEDDEAVKYAIDILEELVFCYYSFDEEDVKRFGGATNSTYMGDIGSGTYIYHFIMNDRIDVYIFSADRSVAFYSGDKLIGEHSFPW